MSNSTIQRKKSQAQFATIRRVEHPLGNTDAGSTRFTSTIDWLAFTVKGDDDDNYDWNDPNYVIGWLGLNANDAVTLPTGHNNHPHGLQLAPGITVSWGGKTKVWKKGVVVSKLPKDVDKSQYMEEVSMGIYVEMTGQGCRYYEQYVRSNWIETLSGVVSVASNVARVDLALDDRIGIINPYMIRDAIQKGQYVGKMRDWDDDTSGKLHRPVTAKTVYIGSPKSDFRIRVYDKAEEQKMKGKQVDGIWTRCELQIRNKRAISAIHHLIRTNDVGRVIKGILREYVDFRVPVNGSDDKNRSRWVTVSWWSAFIDEVEKVKLTVEGFVARTIDQIEQWLEVYVAPNLAVVFESWSGDVQRLIDLINTGRKRWKTKHKLLLQNANTSMSMA